MHRICDFIKQAVYISPSESISRDIGLGAKVAQVHKSSYTMSSQLSSDNIMLEDENIM